MKVFLALFVVFILASCVPNTQVAEVPSTVGYYNYSANLNNLAESRKAACDKDDACKEPAPITEQDVLALITQARNQMQAKGMTVIGIEADKTRIWFTKPVE